MAKTKEQLEAQISALKAELTEIKRRADMSSYYADEAMFLRQALLSALKLKKEAPF